ncbi:unnamed protein product [Ambrosiozyma monospora]|uniref:Unnamed protein product n=1 Tax=Ambrosiozyma monospora TaxID=43982 RepID=A0ACB5T3B0_AMBMO|nr:unnamed protein product [Ambrosiozyma monospora]
MMTISCLLMRRRMMLQKKVHGPKNPPEKLKHQMLPPTLKPIIISKITGKPKRQYNKRSHLKKDIFSGPSLDKSLSHIVTIPVDHSKLAAKNKTRDDSPMKIKTVDELIHETRIPKKKAEVHKSYKFNTPKRKSKQNDDITDEEYTKPRTPPTDGLSPIRFEDSQPEYSISDPQFESSSSQPISDPQFGNSLSQPQVESLLSQPPVESLLSQPISDPQVDSSLSQPIPEKSDDSEYISLSSSRPSTSAGDEAEQLAKSTKLVNDINKELYSQYQSQSDTDDQVTDVRISSDEPSQINSLRLSDTINQKEVDSEPDITYGPEVFKVEDDVRRGGNTKRHLRDLKPKSYEEHHYFNEHYKGKHQRSNKKEEKVQKARTRPNIPTGPSSRKFTKPGRKRRSKSNSLDSDDDDVYTPGNNVVMPRRHLEEDLVEVEDAAIEEIGSIDGDKDVVPSTNRNRKSQRRHVSRSPAQLNYAATEKISLLDDDKDVLLLPNKKVSSKRRNVSESPVRLDDSAIEKINSIVGDNGVGLLSNRKVNSKRRSEYPVIINDEDDASIQQIDRADIFRSNGRQRGVSSNRGESESLKSSLSVSPVKFSDDIQQVNLVDLDSKKERKRRSTYQSSSRFQDALAEESKYGNNNKRRKQSTGGNIGKRRYGSVDPEPEYVDDGDEISFVRQNVSFLTPSNLRIDSGSLQIAGSSRTRMRTKTLNFVTSRLPEIESPEYERLDELSDIDSS